MPALNIFQWRDKPNIDDLEYQNTQHVLDMLDAVGADQQFNIKPLDQYDYAKRARQYARKTDQLRNQLAQKRAQHRNQMLRNSPFTWTNAGFRLPAGGGRNFRSFVNAIAGQESGGNYGVVNKDSGALGKYQIMPSNLAGSGGWDAQYTGRNVSSQFFLTHPGYQEKLARAVLRSYYKKWGPRGAASAWYSGSPDKWKTGAGGGVGYPSVRQYVLDILRRMG